MTVAGAFLLIALLFVWLTVRHLRAVVLAVLIGLVFGYIRKLRKVRK